MKKLSERRAAQLREHTSHTNAGVYDLAGIGGTHVIYVLHDIEHPERYGGLPKDPTIPPLVRIWKGPRRGRRPVLSALRAEERAMIECYPFHERICHWLTGFAYLYCLATGLASYSPYLFWVAATLGGGSTSRFWHPIGWRGDMNTRAAGKE
jgi:hypothetical protein